MATEQPQPQPVRLEAGTYDVLRTRLAVAASELAERAQALNARRLEVFGGSELRLAGSDRIRTGSDCVPRDIVAIGGRLLLGYNLGHAGTRAQIGVDDVLSVLGFVSDGDTFRFEALPADAVPGLLDDPRFRQDFAELYRYYRDARLLQLRLLNGMLLAVFQTGPDLADIRVLRWRIAADGTPGYLDARGEREHVLPPAYDVTWTDTTRDDHVLGRHPHISIGGEVYVSTVAGTLTVKVEDTTETGEAIHCEPVDEPLQSLADAEVSYARAGALILLRIRPYNETVHRYLVFNTRTRSVVRLDGIGQACLRLPDDQGVIFPGGYCLANGAVKIFDTDTDGLEFERVVRSPNGEDVLYIFYARAEGRTLLLPYNVIREAVAAPLTCHGHALFDDGTLVLFRASGDEPARVHPVQVWHTPYTSDTYAAAQPAGTGTLERVGNADLVRGIADCLSAARTARDMTPTAAVYEAITAACERISDRHHWLPEPGLGGLHGPLTQVRATAGQVLEEFDAVTALTAQAAQALDEAAARITSLVRLGRGETLASADAWVRHLTELRRAQGHVASLRELRHANTDRIDALATGLADDLAAAAHRAVAFLARDDAFTGHHQDVARLADQAEAIATTAEAAPVAERLGEMTEGLRTVTEVVTALDIADPVVRTSVLERIAAVLADANRARATLTAHCKELLGREGRAEFAAESALLGQAVTAALAAAGTPDDCEDQLGRLLLKIENLQARFGEHPDFTAELDNQRAGIHDAFSARKQTLLDERTRRADRLADSATRILDSVHRRLDSLASLDEINTYFASDPMTAKVRQITDELRDLGDPVRAEELAGRLKAARQRAARTLRDRADLYDGGDGGTTIRLGRHRFAVTTQRAELTLIPYQGTMAFALTGTDYRSPVPDPEFEATRTYWDQHLVSETPEVYRAEYLAASLLAGTESLDGLYEAAAEDRLLDVVRVAAESRYDEGYERGIHDRDATAILTALLRLRAEAGLLRYPATARAAAQLLWTYGTDEATRTTWSARAVSLARARAAFGLAPAVAALQRELALALATFLDAVGLAAEGTGLAGEYLFEELAESAGAPVAFITGAPARTLLEKFRTAVDGDGPDPGLAALPDDLAALPARHQLAEAWLDSFLTASGEPAGDGDLAEAVALQLCDGLPRRDCPADLTATVEGLLGDHPRLHGRTLHVRLDELLARTAAFHTDRVPGYRAYQRLRTGLLARERTRLRLDELRPAPLTAFVRNRLLDEVYLPLIGDNLAKQLGAVGDAKRTDNSGLLLLISPPGYGKTTLVEYVADRLGLLLVKVSGPALGSSVTSLDEDHPEIKKIHFALAAANNVLLYLDDIQHVSPELLQRFIPLCDATRRLGPYDLRGKRFAVVMSGNPYTESGALFRIPDMLANRADVWNLGDVLTGREDLFALSFIENALTSNPVLALLAAHDRTDVELLLRRAQGDDTVRADQLGRPCAPAEFDRIIAVLTKLLHARRTVLAVNRAYIASAAQADASRTEPPFRLQGSYRNMNKLAERIVPVMNDTELDALIDDHYRAEAQTLTSAAEANLLKLAELRGTLTPAQTARWVDVKAAYTRTAPTG